LELPSSHSDSRRPQESVQTTIDSLVDFIYNSNDSSITPEQSVGGEQRDRDDVVCNRNSESKCSSNVDIEQIQPERVRKVKKRENVSTNINVEGYKKPRKVNPKDHQTVDELLSAVRFWWLKRYRKADSTWRKYRGALKRMAEHPIFPVDLFDPNPDQVVAQLDYIEDSYTKNRDIREGKEDEGIFAVLNTYNAIKALMRSYGRIDEVGKWNYTPPKRPDPKPRLIPSPETVYKLMHFNEYSKDPYENALFQYIFTLSYFVGWRMPSEPAIFKVSDINLESGIITFYQPKVKCYRTVALEKELVDYGNRKSLKNWLDHWRPKVENSKSGEYVFLEPSGRPFTKKYLRKRLNFMGDKVWKNYYPYSARHWCATARLIGYKVKTGVFATREVQDFMQHRRLKETEGYTREAKIWYKAAKYDWIKALLKFHYKNKKIIEQPKRLNQSKSEKGKNTLLPNEIPPVGGLRTRRDSNPRSLA